MNTMKLPVGIDDFRKLRESDFYYVDKTRLIEQILQSWSEVTLFTRPRRFGKTLNMSMLKSFFEIGTDKSLFDGLYISGNKELCEEYMGKYPVVFLSLKSVEGTSFDEARYRIIELISREAERFKFLKDSEGLSENDKNRYNAIISVNDGKYAMDEKLLISSLQVLSQLLFTHFGRKAIIIVDEYDVPLDKAFQNGYYNEMVSLIRGIFGMALKTNEFLQFAVLTGCLRISKESIFTGLNNFRVMSITDARFDEQFGFTDNEVRKLLEDYNMSMHYNDIKEWYDGYHFGKADVYCPWDVILDTKAPDDMKENFYHGLLLGLLRGSNPDWLIKSNRESGDGFSDIMIMPENPDAGIVIEVKYARNIKELDTACEIAMAQIKEKRYDEALRNEGRCDIIAYGIAFSRKRCKALGERL